MAIFSVMSGFLSLCVYLLIGFWFVVTIRFLYNRPFSYGGCYSMGGQSWALGQLPVGLASGPGAGLLMGSWVSGADSLEWGLQDSTWHHQCRQAPQMGPSSAFVPKGIPGGLLPLWEANIGKWFWPWLLKNYCLCLGTRVCEIWKAQSVSCSPSALPYSSPAGLQC